MRDQTCVAQMGGMMIRVVIEEQVLNCNID